MILPIEGSFFSNEGYPVFWYLSPGRETQNWFTLDRGFCSSIGQEQEFLFTVLVEYSTGLQVAVCGDNNDFHVFVSSLFHSGVK